MSTMSEARRSSSAVKSLLPSAEQAEEGRQQEERSGEGSEPFTVWQQSTAFGVYPGGVSGRPEITSGRQISAPVSQDSSLCSPCNAS